MGSTGPMVSGGKSRKATRFFFLGAVDVVSRRELLDETVDKVEALELTELAGECKLGQESKSESEA